MEEEQKTKKSNQNLDEIVEINIGQLKEFENHPFKVKDSDLNELMKSIKQIGVSSPLIVRKIKGNFFEVISGHRRKRACELLGIEEVPCIVRKLTKDEAIIMMVDSNLHREEVLPSEKAFAYKMKYDSLKRQRKRNEENLSQVGTKMRLDEIIASDNNESRNQVQRYIRLTKLTPELLELVDKKRIAVNPAVEISYLDDYEQFFLLKAIEKYEHTPSLSQAQELHRLSKSYQLEVETIEDMLSEEKPNQIPKINISYERLKNYLPRSVVTPREIESYLIKCALFCKQRGVSIERLDIQI